MVVALGPGRFYGSSLPRPRFYSDIKFSGERVDPPATVMDPFLSWAADAHWSMGGLNFSRHRLQGRIEGSIGKLRVQRSSSPRFKPSPPRSVKKSKADKEIKKSKPAKEVKKSDAAKEVKKSKADKEIKKSKMAKEVKKSKMAKEVKKSDAAKEVKKSDAGKEVKKPKAAREIKKSKAKIPSSPDVVVTSSKVEEQREVQLGSTLAEMLHRRRRALADGETPNPKKRARKLGDVFDRIAAEQKLGTRGGAISVAPRTRSRKSAPFAIDATPVVKEAKRKEVDAPAVDAVVARRTSPRKKSV